MTHKEEVKRSLKEASLYLEMRGYNIQELNWSLGKNSIDIIASKNDQINFIKVLKTYNDKEDYYLNLDIINSNIKHPIERWLKINKWQGSYKCLVVTLDEGMSILGFNEILID
ncbi:MAG TPA: hypothetical protein VLF63_03070 [Patescibacteria group bacterium]|nr:hypothetical protein [Patescibacteria group bacterium]